MKPTVAGSSRAVRSGPVRNAGKTVLGKYPNVGSSGPYGVDSVTARKVPKGAGRAVKQTRLTVKYR
jgi:hypothetical protein